MTQIGFYFDQSRCTGCYACVVACCDWHDIQDSALSVRRVRVTEQGDYPHPQVSWLSLSCLHCARPACVAACPAGAITKRAADGAMKVDRESCLGGDACGACREACPWDVPRFDSGPDRAVLLCSLCADRREGGRKPVCVEACPMRALDCGPLEELRQRHGAQDCARGFEPCPEAGPSIVFRERYPDGGSTK